MAGIASTYDANHLRLDFNFIIAKPLSTVLLISTQIFSAKKRPLAQNCWKWKRQNGIATMDWSTQSLDANPIENVIVVTWNDDYSKLYT